MKTLRSILFAIIGVLSLVIGVIFYSDFRNSYGGHQRYAFYDFNVPTDEGRWNEENEKGRGASLGTLQNTLSRMSTEITNIGFPKLEEGFAAFFFINGLVLLTISIPTNIRKTRKSER